MSVRKLGWFDAAMIVSGAIAGSTKLASDAFEAMVGPWGGPVYLAVRRKERTSHAL